MNSKEEFTVQMKRKVAEIEEILKEAGSEYHVNHVSSLGSLFFAKEEVVDYGIQSDGRGKKTAANVNERDQQIIWR